VGNDAREAILSKLGNNKSSRKSSAKSKAKTRAEWQRHIWEMLVAYVNTSVGEEFRAFTLLVNAGMDWIGGEGLDHHGNMNDLESCRDVKAGASLDTLANRYKADMRGLLTWLAGRADTTQAARSCEFLMHHGNAIELHWEATTGDTLISEWPESCGSVVSPICRFLKDQIDRHDIDSEPLRSAIPIALCDRPGCGRFRLVKASRDAAHVFCSNLCKATFHQAARGKEKNAQLMREYRERIDPYKPKRVLKKDRKRVYAQQMREYRERKNGNFQAE
jgi:hypothetical protein